MRLEKADYLQRIYEAIWRRLGASAEEATVCAQCFVNADLAGKVTQGIAAIPLLYPWIRDGAMQFGTPLAVVKDGPSFAVLNAHGAPGQVAATRGMELAVQKARESAVGCVWITHSNDFTMASNYSTIALRHDCFGLAMCNGVPLVAPWGGRDAVFNTSPMSFAVPAGDERPIIYDGATSSVSHGQVVLAARDKRHMSGSPLVGEDGRITDDPVPLTVDPFDRNSAQLGAIQSLGPKGFAWLILVEVVSALIAGASRGKEIPFHQSAEAPFTGGIFLMAIDIAKLIDIKSFKSEVDRLIKDCKASRLAEGFERIVMPGERAQEEAEIRRRDGVSLREEDWANIIRITAELGINLDALRTGSDARL